MGQLLNDTGAPLYKQLYEAIMEKIKSGEYKMGDRIPAEPELIKMYGVSRITVRNAIQQLVDDKVLVKRHGKGTYVAMPVYVESMVAEGSFTKSCLQQGKTPSTKVIQITHEKVSDEIARSLNVEKDKEVICVERLRLVDETPAIYEIDYFIDKFDFIEHEELDKQPILDILRKHTGIVAHVFEDIIEVSYADEKQAKNLDVSEHDPLLKVNQTVIDQNNQIIYFNIQYIHSDVYKMAVRSYK
ncbi:GntR family transcriptional regulator [Breznakia sp. PF5-3]|uniref:GntR family transcriptional regulator n=1 Tax=unclassified Breznakia TaxID=2623764 RepID=UPI0024054C10|nr:MULTISPECIES: GntR family transcriptional regulator [unclassified Breznakia]MDF9825402.1 GntR family transcriptional regulator [Breznakia sp. PM6-1]MDF9836280.1 GntR family transcriptional regulator [Breznakia sp. PF5-3]